MVFTIHWHESAMDLHVFPIPIPPPTSLPMGEGEGGMFWENSIQTSILSRVKQITSPGWMHETSAQGWFTGKSHVSFSIFVSWEYMPRSGIARSYMVILFIVFFRTLHAIFHRGCISLHSHQQCKSVLFSPHPLQYLLFVDFWRWSFWLVWGDISL